MVCTNTRPGGKRKRKKKYYLARTGCNQILDWSVEFRLYIYLIKLFEKMNIIKIPAKIEYVPTQYL